MKRILILLAAIISVAQAQFSPTSSKTAFKNGISIGTRDSTAYSSADSLILVINRAGRLMYRSIDGYWRILSNAGSSDYVPYFGANSRVDLGVYRIKADAYDLAIPGTSTDTIGRLRWSTDDLTVNMGLSQDVVLQTGQEMLILVKNQTGATIPNGTVVRQSGVVGASGRLKIEPFLANGTHNSNQVLGVTTEDIPNGSDGFVASFGKVRGLNTSAYPDSTILYASTTVAGGLTDTIPEAPNNIVKIGTVVNSSASNGIIFTRVVAGSNINQDEKVQLTNPLNNSLLVYDSLTTLWKDKTLFEIGAVRVQDTAAMLNPYLRKSDTATMLAPFVQYSDTTGLYSQVVRTFGTQTVGGNKTFSNDIVVNGLTVGRGGGNSNSNTSFGLDALKNNISIGLGNTAIGSEALITSTLSSNNTAIGNGSLYSHTSGDGRNTAVGRNSLFSNTNGTNNTAIGFQAGFGSGSNGNTTGSNNSYFGYNSVGSAVGNSNETVIGASATGNGSNTVTIGNSSVTDNYFSGNLRSGGLISDSLITYISVLGDTVGGLAYSSPWRATGTKTNIQGVTHWHGQTNAIGSGGGDFTFFKQRMNDSALTANDEIWYSQWRMKHKNGSYIWQTGDTSVVQDDVVKASYHSNGIPTSDRRLFWKDSTNTMVDYFTAKGSTQRIGFKNANPTTDFDFTGQIKASNYTTTGGVYNAVGSLGAVTTTLVSDNSFGYVGTNTNNPLKIRVNSSTVATFNSTSTTFNGNVGVGGSALERFTVTGATGTTGYVRFTDNTSSLFIGNSSGVSYLHSNSNELAFGASGSNVFSPTLTVKNGDVLINTTTTDGTNKLIVNGGVKFGTGGTATITSTGAATFSSLAGTGDRVVVANSSGTLSTSYTITSGTYTPTVSSESNCTGVTPSGFKYMRVGNVVQVSGMINYTISSVASTGFRLSLPVSSDFTTSDDLTGTGGDGRNYAYQITSNPSTDNALISVASVISGGALATITFSYIVK